MEQDNSLEMSKTYRKHASVNMYGFGGYHARHLVSAPVCNQCFVVTVLVAVQIILTNTTRKILTTVILSKLLERTFKNLQANTHTVFIN